MSMLDDEFDLDIRISAVGVGGAATGRPGVLPRSPQADQDETVAPQQTCLAETCGIDCVTQTCETCGCNTSETCTHQCANPDAMTFGPYCDVQTGGEDTCHACPEPSTPGCPDPPD